ncbi:MAG: ferrochelatase [Bacteroidetes bacterium RIFCSPLOWO2_02_FULL_36_8]|nr:MAG: ferrochelatase [Bacteroidetes bacterium RIFCSPLOWO2_02_FULL_36_8]OFY70293.1 MAG: ferrochelatase [Bacteroidetes bacterium RIFCSPLOWO2_12_FULL_37_12]
MPPKTAVLLVNIGTPDSCSVTDVRKYLKEFLSDPRVFDPPWYIKYPLLYTVILPFRSPVVARAYKEILTNRGLPLHYHSEDIKNALQYELGNSYQVYFAMNYGNPSLSHTLEMIQKDVCEKLVIVPLFPQYAGATTGSAIEKIFNIISNWQIIPKIHFVSDFYSHPGFIHANIEICKTFINSSFDHFLFSFHGLPEHQIKKADLTDYCKFNNECCSVITSRNRYCYRASCYQTVKLIAEPLGFTAENYSVCFQSRFGKKPWLKPYIDEHLENLVKKGVKRLLVSCPSFVSDCLETIHEVGEEYKELFLKKGGVDFQLVPCLNSHPAWVKGLAEIVGN